MDFFSSLATSSHTLRDLSKTLYERWCIVHSDISGLKCAKKLWPKVVGGRWNSCSEALARMKQVGGQSKLEPVLRDLLESKQKNTLLAKQMRMTAVRMTALVFWMRFHMMPPRPIRLRWVDGESKPGIVCKILCGGLSVSWCGWSSLPWFIFPQLDIQISEETILRITVSQG